MSPFRPPRFVRAYRPAIAQAPTQVDGAAAWAQRAAHLGVFAIGLVVSVIAFPHREKLIGAIALGAGASTVGVALTFLIMDILDAAPASV